MEELKLDKMVVNTKLAEDYLENNKSIFHSVLTEGKVIPASDYKEDVKNIDYEEKLKILATKVEENAELFAQLEALKRNLSIDVVKNVDIKLILQYLRFGSLNKLKLQFPRPNMHSQDMKRNSPLANLGVVVYPLRRFLRIKCCEATVAVCYLFVQLCGQAGFTHVSLELSDDLQETTSDSKFACTGVVTEHSDVDSAVDTFLSSTSQHPMKLHRLFIQESVYQRFKEALTWKCNLKQSQCTEDTALSAEVKTYEDKVFIFDYTGTDHIEDTRHVILVEAYRTVKELLSILKKSEVFGLSLWSSDLSEANEISFSVDIPIVWVNDFGVFGGPDNCSHAYYSYLFNETFDLDSEAVYVDNITQVRQNWSQMTVNDRIEKIKDVLKKIRLSNGNYAGLIWELEKGVQNFKSNRFTDIESNKLWVGVNKSMGILASCVPQSFEVTTDTMNTSDLLLILQSIIYGNYVLWSIGNGVNDIFRILNLLGDENLPVKSYNFEKPKGTAKVLKICSTNLIYRTCVVYTKFGTTFAN